MFVFFSDELLFDRVVGPDADFGEGRVGHHGLTDGAVLVWIERTAQVDLAQAARLCAGDVLVQRDERCLTAVHEIEEGLDQRRREWTDGVHAEDVVRFVVDDELGEGAILRAWLIAKGVAFRRGTVWIHTDAHLVTTFARPVLR